MQQPRLRFKEFGYEWKSEQLQSKFDGIHNAFVGKASPYYTNKDDGHFYLESNNVKNGHINKNKQIFINDFFYNKQKNKWLHTNDLVMVQSGDIGSTAVITKKFNNSVAHALIQLTNPINVDTFFLNSIFQNSIYRNKIRLITVGNTVKHILSSDVQSLFVKFPSVTEQTKIGHYFRLLDQMIELQQAKLKHLKNLKKSYLQKMFANRDEPRLRFNEFNDKWRIEKLNSFLLIPQKEKAEIKGLNDIMTLKLHFKGLRKSSSRETLSLKATNYYIRHKGQLIYGKQNFFYGSIAIIPNEFDGLATSQDVPSLNISNIDKNYLLYFISRKPFLAYSKRFATGTGSKRLHERNLLNLKISVPSHFEQNQIGRFFNLLDQQIKLANKKLTTLQQDKKGYLQNMFI